MSEVRRGEEKREWGRARRVSVRMGLVKNVCALVTAVCACFVAVGGDDVVGEFVAGLGFARRQMAEWT